MYLNPGIANILTNTSYALHSSASDGKAYPVRIYSAYVYGSGSTTIGTLRLMNNAAVGTEFLRLCAVGTGELQWNYLQSNTGWLFPNGCWACPDSRTTYSTIVYEVLPA